MVRQDHQSQDQKAPATAEKEKKSPSSRMLSNDEIKEICEKNTLSRGEVYEIRTQFASMCMMSEQWQQQNGANNGSATTDMLNQTTDSKRGGFK
jgi:hypothetical protein